MAYFPSSNYDDHQYQSYHDNYQYYQQPYNYDQHESRYVQHYYDHTQYYDSSYQLAPSEPLTGYYYSTYNTQPGLLSSKDSNFHENSDFFYDPVTTQFVISYSNVESEVNDLEFEDYNPEPYHGGYDISETYGKALPPSIDICYPPSKNVPLSLDDSSVYKGVTSPYGKEVQNLDEGGEKLPISNVLPERDLVSEDDENEDEDEDEEDDDNDNDNIVSHVIQEDVPSKSEGEEEENRGNMDDENATNEEEKRGDGEEIRRQIPPGYGLEAMDICDRLFGGYFPCILKRNKRDCNQCGGEVSLRKDDYEPWGDTVDYFFGNPNPYGGSMPEKGSYGDPMYSYQRHYPQEAISGQVQYEENSLLMDSSSRHYYGHNDDYQYY